PRLSARIDQKALGAWIDAYDVVSRDTVRIQIAVNGAWREVVPDKDGFVSIPEMRNPDAEIAVAAIDQQGLRAELILRTDGRVVEAPAAGDVSAEDRKTGCGCIAEPHGSGFGLGLVLPILMTALRGHRRRGRQGEEGTT